MGINYYVYNLHTHMRNCQYCVQSSYPHVQLPISCTIIIPTCAITNFVYNLHTKHAQLPTSCTIFIPTCAIANFVYNHHTHMRNCQLRVQSSYQHAQLPTSCTIIHTHMRNCQFSVQSSNIHAQLPTSCTIFIPTCAITYFVYNLHIHMRNYQLCVQISYHKRIYQFSVKSSYPHAELPISGTILIYTCALTDFVYTEPKF